MASAANGDYVVGYTFEDIERMSSDVLKHTDIRPTLGIICGTGLDGLGDAVENPTIVPYDTIPGFPRCTVKGHQGKFVFGHISGKPLVLMIGRFHYYEGYPMWKVAMPVRVMKAMGVDTLIVTNAAGGLNPGFKIGDIMLVKDHIDLPGMTGHSVLRGQNDERFGPRFLPTNSTYDPALRALFKQVAQRIGQSDMVREGVFVMEGGPTFISLTECKLLRTLGADAIGMSTVPEAIVAKHCGVKVLAFSFISDLESQEEEERVELSHDDVLKAAREKAPVLQDLIRNFIAEL